MKYTKIVYRFHAVRRMFERKITEEEVEQVLKNGVDIEVYPEDQPYPSRLMLGFVGQRPIHIVVSDAFDVQESIIITVYEPDLQTWESGFKQRRKK